MTTAALGVLGVSLVACGGGGSGGSATQAPAKSAATQSAGGGTAAAGGAASASEITMVGKDTGGKDNKFDPKDLTVAVGQAVKVNFKNEGTAIHDMHVLSTDTEGKDFMTGIIVNPGETSTFTMTFTKKATIKFICDYHQPDMTGSITVK